MMPEVKPLTATIVHELAKLMESSPQQLEAIEAFAGKLLQADRIFVAGAGRSGLMGKAFAMRLMHLGLAAYVVGETITPGIAGSDVLVLGSGSGETGSLAAMAGKAKQLGASVLLVTINPDSSIGRQADAVAMLHASPKDAEPGAELTVQPMGSLFEQGLLIFYDAVILKLMELKGMNGRTMYGSHANLE